jgi:hypothetical protein
VLERFARITFEPAVASPEELLALQARDKESWARVIRDANVTVE